MMPLSSYAEHMNAPTLTRTPSARRTIPRPYKTHRPHAMSLRVIEPPNAPADPPDSVGVKLFDRLHVFTSRLGHFGLQTSPRLGNGYCIAA